MGAIERRRGKRGQALAPAFILTRSQQLGLGQTGARDPEHDGGLLDVRRGLNLEVSHADSQGSGRRKLTPAR